MTQLTDSQIAGLAKVAGIPENEIPRAVAIALAESEGKTDVTNTKNHNGTIDYGLYQINSSHKDLLASGNWQNPLDNTRMAFALFAKAGGKWTDWATFLNGKFLVYMPRGIVAAKNPDTTTVGSGQTVGFGIPNPFDPIIKLAEFIGDPKNWMRLGYFLAGGLLIVIGLMRLTGTGKYITQVAAVA